MTYCYKENYAGNDRFAVLSCPICGSKNIEKGNFKEYKYRCECCGSNFGRLSYSATKTVTTEPLLTKCASIKDSKSIKNEDISWKPIIICGIIFMLTCIFITACMTNGFRGNVDSTKDYAETVQSEIAYQNWTCNECGWEFDERYYNLESIKVEHVSCAHSNNYNLEDKADWGSLNR